MSKSRPVSVSFIVKTFVNNVVRSVFHKHEVLQNLQNKFVQIWVFHDFFHDLLNSMTFPWPKIFHDFSMTSHFPWLFHDRRNPGIGRPPYTVGKHAIHPIWDMPKCPLNTHLSSANRTKKDRSSFIEPMSNRCFGYRSTRITANIWRRFGCLYRKIDHGRMNHYWTRCDHVMMCIRSQAVIHVHRCTKLCKYDNYSIQNRGAVKNTRHFTE